MKISYRFLFVLHIVVGIGAIAGGLAAILNPQEPLGTSVEILKDSPFKDFLIPGIILFAVLGLGNLTGALTTYLRTRFHGHISSVFGFALFIWIVTQSAMLGLVLFLHVLFFIIAVIQVVLSMIIIFKEDLFPAKIVIYFYIKIKSIINS